MSIFLFSKFENHLALISVNFLPIIYIYDDVNFIAMLNYNIKNVIDLLLF